MRQEAIEMIKPASKAARDSEPERYRWAVCPPLGVSETPKLFLSESDAEELQEAVDTAACLDGRKGRIKVSLEKRGVATPIDTLSGPSNDFVVVRRSDTKDLPEVEELYRSSRKGQGYFRIARPPIGLRPEVTNRRAGWCHRVPVRWMDEYETATYTGRRLREHTPLDDVDPVAPSYGAGEWEEELDAIDDNSPEITCDLAPDWNFPTIEQTARNRTSGGSRMRKLRYKSLPEGLARAAHDLEDALWERHPVLSPAAVADFWTSWRVWDNLETECSKIVQRLIKKAQREPAYIDHDDPHGLPGAFETVALANMQDELHAYAGEVRAWAAPREAAAKPLDPRGAGAEASRKKPGPKPDTRTLKIVAEAISKIGAGWQEKREDLGELLDKMGARKPTHHTDWETYAVEAPSAFDKAIKYQLDKLPELSNKSRQLSE